MYKSIAFVLSLAAAAKALPAPQSGSAAGAVPPKSEEFALAMTVDGTLVSLNAVCNGTSELVLAAERLSVYPGTPVYINGTSPDAALNFDLTSSTDVTPGVYGIKVPMGGNNAGYAANVVAVKDYQEFEFSVSSDHYVSHDRTAALQNWYACKDTVNGVENYVLRWGVMQTDGNPPEGCQATSMTQNFNVPGGANSS